MSDKACAAEPSTPVRPWIRIARPLLARLAARRNEYGDEKAWGGRWLAFHVYRWGYRSFGDGSGWYEEWRVLLMWRGGHRSFHLCDIQESA